MPISLYQVLHIVGIAMLFLGYGALLGRSMSGSDHAGVKKLGSITSGIGLVLMLIAGFGLVAKLGHSYTAHWIIVKMIIWLALGGLIVLINRKPALATILWWALVGLAAVASTMVYYVRFYQ